MNVSPTGRAPWLETRTRNHEHGKQAHRTDLGKHKLLPHSTPWPSRRRRPTARNIRTNKNYAGWMATPRPRQNSKRKTASATNYKLNFDDRCYHKRNSNLCSTRDPTTKRWQCARRTWQSPPASREEPTLTEQPRPTRNHMV